MLCAIVCEHGLDPAIQLVSVKSHCTSIQHDSDGSPLFYAETFLILSEPDVKQCSVPTPVKKYFSEKWCSSITVHVEAVPWFIETVLVAGCGLTPYLLHFFIFFSIINCLSVFLIYSGLGIPSAIIQVVKCLMCYSIHVILLQQQDRIFCLKVVCVVFKAALNLLNVQPAIMDASISVQSRLCNYQANVTHINVLLNQVFTGLKVAHNVS